MRKTFVGHGTFVGEVVRCTPYTDKVLFSVQYPDGDQEDMDLEEVKQHLVPVGEKTQAGSRASSSSSFSSNAAAAITAATALLVRSAVPGRKDSEMGECSDDGEDSGGESREE